MRKFKFLCFMLFTVLSISILTITACSVVFDPEVLKFINYKNEDQDKIVDVVIGDLGSSSFVSYKREYVAVDLGYCPKDSSVTKKVEIVNVSENETNFLPNVSKASFTITADKNRLRAGESAVLTIKYVATDENTWDEADLQLTEKATVKLIGSGYKQPSNVASKDKLQFWLRADIAGVNNIIAETNLVKRMTDYSDIQYHENKKANHALPLTHAKCPTWKADGINGLPAIAFDNGNYLQIGFTENELIYDNADGISVFVVCNNKRENVFQPIVCAYKYGEKSFPYCGTLYANYDETKGYSAIAQYGLLSLGGAGIEALSSPRYAFDEAEKLVQTEIDKPYSTLLMFDSKFGGKDNNIFMQTNGKPNTLSYTYTYSETSYNKLGLYDNNKTCYGAYGKPVSDGKGNRHADLGNTKPGDGDWKTKIKTGPRAYDYGYTLTSGTSGTLQNRVTPEKANGLTKFLIGADNNSPTPRFFYGEIAEIMVFNCKLTDDDIAIVNNYIKQRYNIGE